MTMIDSNSNTFLLLPVAVAYSIITRRVSRTKSQRRLSERGSLLSSPSVCHGLSLLLPVKKEAGRRKERERKAMRKKRRRRKRFPSLRGKQGRPEEEGGGKGSLSLSLSLSALPAMRRRRRRRRRRCPRHSRGRRRSRKTKRFFFTLRSARGDLEKNRKEGGRGRVLIAKSLFFLFSSLCSPKKIETGSFLLWL